MTVHGGFWRNHYNLGLMRPVAESLRDRGWAVWNVEYRRLGGGGGWPATFEDVAAAVDALADLDAPLDLERVLALGHSAGGHLALWAAARPGLPAEAPGAGPRVRVAAAVGQAPGADLEEVARRGLFEGAALELLGGGPEDVPDRYAVASPARLLPLGVPLLLVHGEADEGVPPELSTRFAEAAQAAGDACELALVRGEAHSEHTDPASMCWREVVIRLDALVPEG